LRHRRPPDACRPWIGTSSSRGTVRASQLSLAQGDEDLKALRVGTAFNPLPGAGVDRLIALLVTHRRDTTLATLLTLRLDALLLALLEALLEALATLLEALLDTPKALLESLQRSASLEALLESLQRSAWLESLLDLCKCYRSRPEKNG